MIISHGLDCDIGQLYPGAEFMMNENINPRVELSHLTLSTITDYLSLIIQKIIRYVCPN